MSYELMHVPSVQTNSYILVTTKSKGNSVAARHYPSSTQMIRHDGRNLPSYAQLKVLALAQGPILPQKSHSTEDCSHWFEIINAANQIYLSKSGSPTLSTTASQSLVDGLNRGSSTQSTPPIPTVTRHPISTKNPPHNTIQTQSIALADSSIYPNRDPIQTKNKHIFFSNNGQPLISLSDWQSLHPPGHWRAGYSAMELARTWHHAQNIPLRVLAELIKGPFNHLKILYGIAECLTAIPGRGRSSHTDLMVEVLTESGDPIILGVEGKVNETFGPTVQDWLNKKDSTRSLENKEERLHALLRGLGIARCPSNLRYQLLHRAYATLHHAQSINLHSFLYRTQPAKQAVLVIHSFDSNTGIHQNQSDFILFLQTLGVSNPHLDQPNHIGVRMGVDFWAVWAQDTFLPSSAMQSQNTQKNPAPLSAKMGPHLSNLETSADDDTPHPHINRQDKILHSVEGHKPSTDVSGGSSNGRKIIIVATPNGLAELAEQILPRPLFSRKSSRIKGLINADPNELMLKIGELLKLGTPPKFFNPSDAMRLFNFGVGHTPGNGDIYIQHPISTNTYIKPEKFREILAKEKEAAFRQLAASLGAKKLTLTDVQFDDKKIKSKASISKAALTVGIQAQFDSKGSFIKSIYSEFGPPRGVPHVPATLEPWVAMEPELKTMVHGRLDGHLINSIVNLEFRKELGIEGEICAQLLDKGGTIGATYQKIHHSIWSFEVEYYPL